jgi:thymidylate synthase
VKQYRALVRDILKNGTESDDRTGVGTISVFGRQMRFDLSKGFPLVTSKRTHWKSVLIELLWLMRGETNIKFMKNHNVKIWDEWADDAGELGPVYGQQWRAWIGTPEVCHGEIMHDNYIDQLDHAIHTIKTNPNSRRIIISAWNVGEVDNMALPPCHTLFQFYVRNGKLSCQLYQRSADLFLGVPFNIASYAALTHLVANECGLEVGEFVHTFGDVHIYKNHIPKFEEMLKRSPLKLPELEITLKQGELMGFVDEYCQEMDWDTIKTWINLKNYRSHNTIKGKVAV